MCDTMVALGNSTADGSVIFAKNSDREPNEAHYLTIIPASDHEIDSEVQCTYISVPQVEHTNAVLLAKPFWIWGAEMAANEHGIVIGNEAIFSKVPYGKEPGLIGMDFLRLALERADTARGAMQVIIDLLEKYGQGGNCGFAHKLFYHNSFLIADLKDAWVLETAGQQWAAVQVKDVRSISNGLTIETEWDLASEHLVDYAVEMGWCKDRAKFNFRENYSDFIYTRFSDSQKRQHCTMEELRSHSGEITVKTMIDILSSHAGSGGQNWSPDKGIFGADVCMHAGFGPVRGSQSIGSMVSHLTLGQQTHWVTGTSAPCTGVFKPVWVDAGLPPTGAMPDGMYNPSSMFWRHEMLHREVLRNYAARHKAYNSERIELQERLLAEVQSCETASTAERLAFSQDCFKRVEKAETNWLKLVQAEPAQGTHFYTRLAWDKFNRDAGINLS